MSDFAGTLSQLKSCAGNNPYYNVDVNERQEIEELCVPDGSIINRTNEEKQVLCPNQTEWEYIGVTGTDCRSDMGCNGRATGNVISKISRFPFYSPNLQGSKIQCKRTKFNGDPIQCCLNNKLSNSTLELSDGETCDIKYRDYDNLSCQSVLGNYCKNDNLGKQECIDFCDKYPDRCSQNISNYCDNNINDINNQGTICNKYYNLNNTFRETLNNNINRYCNKKGDDINDYNINDDICIDYCRNNIDNCRSTAVDYCGRLNPYVLRESNKLFNPYTTDFPTSKIDHLCGCLYNKQEYKNFYNFILRSNKFDNETLQLINDPTNTFDISCYATDVCKSDGVFYSKEFLGNNACPTTQCIQSINTQIQDSNVGEIKLDNTCLFNNNSS